MRHVLPFKVRERKRKKKKHRNPSPNTTIGDAPILAAAQVQIRQGFQTNAQLEASEPAAKDAILHANEVASFLRANLVQGKKMNGEENTYSA